MNIEYKVLNYKVNSCDEKTINGVQIGIVRGYLAAFSKDRGNDVIQKGAFLNTIEDHKKRGNRPIRMFWQHDSNQVIGAIPIFSAYEDEKGLFAEGHINLDVQKGREAYALAKQDVITDFSIGFIPTDFEYIKDGDDNTKSIRVIKSLDLFEVSLVSEPMNIDAMVTEVKKFYKKSTSDFKEYPLAPRNYKWDSEEADKRVRTVTNSNESPSIAYKDAFFWYDENNKENFGAYKLPYVDVVDGELKAIPNAIFAATESLKGLSDEVQIPEYSKQATIAHINKYYIAMGMKSPLEEKEDLDKKDCEEDMKSYIDYNTLMNSEFTKRDLQKVLNLSKCFSNRASKTLASALDVVRCDVKNIEAKTVADIKNDIERIKKLVNKW